MDSGSDPWSLLRKKQRIRSVRSCTRFTYTQSLQECVAPKVKTQYSCDSNQGCNFSATLKAIQDSTDLDREKSKVAQGIYATVKEDEKWFIPHKLDCISFLCDGEELIRSCRVDSTEAGNSARIDYKDINSKAQSLLVPSKPSYCLFDILIDVSLATALSIVQVFGLYQSHPKWRESRSDDRLNE